MIKWANNEMNFKKEVMELAGFLKIVNDPDGDLLLGLLHIIYEKFPPTDSKIWIKSKLGFCEMPL